MQAGAQLFLWTRALNFAADTGLTAGLIHESQSIRLIPVSTALRYMLWWLAALYVIMTISIWIATIRTLGFSSIRHCPRMLRLAFRASPIRELFVVIILPLLAIPLISKHLFGAGYLSTFPLGALVLIGLLCFTLFIVPPTTLVFSSSTDRQLRWTLPLKRFTGGRRVISLLDTGYLAVKPSAGDIWSIMMKRSISLTDVLRTSDTKSWQEGVKELIEISPVVVVDTRVCTRAVLYEASTMLTPEHAYKAIFVSEDDGACPVLERLLDEGRIGSDRLVSVVTEAELGPLLQRLVVSGDTLPKPGSFATTPSTIGEITARRGLPRQAECSPVTAPIQSSHIATAGRPNGRKRLSTALTPYWRLTARGMVVPVLLSIVVVLWLILTSPQRASSSFSTVVLISLNVLCGGVCAFYFHLGYSLKKVSIEGDHLFASDNSKESDIHISQISRVTGPDWTTMRRITIHLHKPSVFGEKIVFAGKIFTAGMIARDLRRKLYSHAEAKSQSGDASHTSA